ncbi:MAG: hypothetical protein ACK4YP_05065, partial [Myxococcota bacterium]
PGYAPNPIAGCLAAAPPMAAPQPLVSCPVGSYGGAAGGTPFQVAGPTPTGNSNSESRVQSMRIVAILLGVLALACVAFASVIALYFLNEKSKEETESVAQVAPAPVAKAKPAANEDTASEPAPAPKPPPAATRQRTTTSGASKAPSAPAAPKLGATATLNVTFTGAMVPTSVEVSCPGGFRDRKPLSGGSTAVASVPTGETCQLHPKGAGAPTSTSVRGGQSLNCQIIGTTTSCK